MHSAEGNRVSLGGVTYLLGRPARFLMATYDWAERGLAHSLPPYRGWGVSVSFLLVLTLAVAAHGLAARAQPLMLYPDSTSFVGKADSGLHGGKVWRGDCQIMPGLPYVIYGLGRLFPWPINAPLRVMYHGCLIVSLLCGYGIIRMLTRSYSLATVAALSGLLNLSYLVLGNQLITEPLYSGLVSVIALLLCAYAVRPRLGLLWLAGFLIGSAALVRPTGIYMAGLPLALVGATAWLARRRPDWPPPLRQLAALGGCWALIAACIAPALYFNHKNQRFWGLTNYFGINLYARVVDYDNVHDSDGPAMRRIMELWEKHAARVRAEKGEAALAAEGLPGQPGWRYHWSCMFVLVGDGGLSRLEADRLMKRAALEGIRKDPAGYVLRTAKNLVDVLACDQGLFQYTDREPPPVDYPKNYFAPGQPHTLSPYKFNKASLGCARDECVYSMIDCYEPFGGPGVVATWRSAVALWKGSYLGVSWEHRLRMYAWLTIGGALISLLLRPRLGWWLLLGLLGLHIVGAVAIEWPLARYRVPFDMLLLIYPWLCLTGPLALLRSIAKWLIPCSTVTATPAQPSLPEAA